jgi:hypothetical protein
MDRRSLISNTFVCLAGLNARTAGIAFEAISRYRQTSADKSEGSTSQTSPAHTQTTSTVRNPSELTERIFKREKEQVETIENTAPIVETYIQEEKSDALMGTVPKKDLYFLGQADFRGKTMRVHSMTARIQRGSLNWSYDPAGFLQMAFLDLRDFDSEHYRLTSPPNEKRAFLGDVRCYVFDVDRAPKVKGPRFEGRIWVEDQDFTIVRMNGTYAPERRFSLKHFDNEFYEHFDSWRTNVRSGLWLPSDIYIQDLRDSPPTGGPRFKARTHLWGYGLTSRNRQEELGRLLVETEGQVKDESEKQDRSPLEQQRGWRELSGNNVMDVLQRVGLMAPEGDVEKVLNTIVNNILTTNNFDPRVEIRCRLLMTSNFELFSMQKTIVLSRGLIDVVPNEETLAALLAFEIADAMVPKPAQDQYGFSDILRLTPTDALKKLSFVDNQEEARRNSERALEWLRKSPYGDKLANVGLFFSQLQSQKQALKQLISARLGNQVYFTWQLLELAPAIDPGNVLQISALPMGSRIKINPWNDGVSLMKTQQMPPISPREKIPFEVTPINLYLTRYVESAEGEHAIVPRSQFPVAVARDKS